MAIDVAWFEKKVYGYPYAPSNAQELLGLLQIYSRQAFYYGHDQFSKHYLEQEIWGWVYLIRDIFLVYMIGGYIMEFWRFLMGHGICGSIVMAYRAVTKKIFKFILSLPPIKTKLDGELNKTIDKIHEKVIVNDNSLAQFPGLPEQGWSNVEILKELDKLQELKHTDWSNGRVSGAVYHGGFDLLELQSDAYHKYSIANQLHPDVFPGVRKMESEVVAMVLKLFKAPESGCGCTTSGGTESLLLAGLAAREFGKRKKGITKPEVIAPVTIHAGIEKACYYFGMKLHKVELDNSYRVDLKRVKKLINSNTVLLVGSAPNYPHGIIDDIEGLSKLATKYSIPLHVDACLGSFIVAFLERSHVHDNNANITIPKFDFRLPGVTSMSCDTHKYGFAPKGSSLIMYRHPELRECQYYISSDWTGGMYGSPTLAGSRPGALMVGCWATLVNIGDAGYSQFCRDIVGTTMKFKSTIQAHPVLSKNLEVIGDPIASVIAFKSKNPKLSIYSLGDILSDKGWHFASLQKPAALHFAFTKLTIPIIDELIADLVSSTEHLEQNSLDNSANKDDGDTAAVYGVAGSVSTVGVADRIIVAFLDALYKL